MNSSFRARFVVAAIALSGWFTGVGASVLSDAAAQLQPGQWVLLNTQNFNAALLDDGAAYQVFQYSEDMVWDPVSHQLLFVGGGHNSDAEYLRYNEATNSWTRTKPGGGPWACCSSHAYDGNAIIPAANKLFFHQMAWDQADRLDVVDIPSGAWTRTAPMAQHPGCCVGLEYFPELGGLVMADGRTGVQFYDESADRWSMITSNVGFGEYHNFAEYSPVHKVLVYGGGEGSGGSAVFRLNANRQITRLSDAPQTVGITHAIWTTDPNSGNFVVFFGGNVVYEMNPMTDTWRRITMTVPWNNFGEGGVWSTVATPISTYGVIAFAKYNGNDSRVYLYRHSPGTGAVQPTVNLTANPTSVADQGSTTLTWSTSNADDCTASGGWTGTKTTSGSETRGPLTANTTFTLTCTNTDGGTAARSVTVTVTSATPAPTVNLSASPTSVAAGGSSTLSWTTSNATSCNGTGGISGWPGSKSVPNGSQSVGPLNAAATFGLSCTGAGGTTQRSVTVNLIAAPTVNFTANPTTVASGSRTALNWSSQNATACSASGAWAGSKPASGSEQSAVLTQTSTFNLDCTGAGGSTGRSVTVMVTSAPPPPPPPPAAPTLTLTASATSVAPNTQVTLTWSSTNATACTASGGWSGSRAMSGSEQSAALTNTTDFALNCTGAGGSVARQVTVTVVPGGGGGGGGGGDTTPEESGGGSLDLLLLSIGSMLIVFRVRRRHYAGAAHAS